MAELLKKLCALNGVSGDEGAVAEFIINEIKDYCDVRVLNNGSIVAYKKGKADKTVMLCAHMDEVGFIVKDITDDGYLKFMTVGGIDRRVILGKRVTVNGITGVVGLKAIHLVKRDDRKNVPQVSDMYIDIGAESREDALKYVNVGDYVSFNNDVVEFGDGYLKAKAIDDRAGCAVLIDVLKKDWTPNIKCVFTVNEEVGTRGAQGVFEDCDMCLVVEGTTAGDVPSVSGQKEVCKLCDGVVIPFMDRGTIYNKKMFSVLCDIADKNGIKWQTKSMVAGGTDASAIQRQKTGVITAGVAVPIRYIHSPSSVCTYFDYDCLKRLTESFLDGGYENV